MQKVSKGLLLWRAPSHVCASCFGTWKMMKLVFTCKRQKCCRGESNTKEEMINAIQEIFGPPETWNYMDEANPVSSCSYFYFKAFCISPSIYSFSCLFFWPFVLEQLCGCAYIMRNPAWQWEQERDGKKPFHPSINYYCTCLRLHSFYSLLYCCAFWPPVM